MKHAVIALVTIFWTWQALDGSVAFTDDAKRIPAEARARATQGTVDGLEGYQKGTEVDAVAAALHRAWIEERSDELYRRAMPRPR